MSFQAPSGARPRAPMAPMALRVCYISGEVLTELTMAEEDTGAKVKAAFDLQSDHQDVIT